MIDQHQQNELIHRIKNEWITPEAMTIDDVSLADVMAYDVLRVCGRIMLKENGKGDGRFDQSTDNQD